MVRCFGVFDSVTRDMTGLVTLSRKGDEPYEGDQASLVVELPERVEEVGDWMLDESDSIVKRTEFGEFDKTVIAADGIEVTKLSGLPSGTQARVNLPSGNVTETISDGVLEITCDVPWSIYVEVRAANHKWKSYVLEAV